MYNYHINKLMMLCSIPITSTVHKNCPSAGCLNTKGMLIKTLGFVSTVQMCSRRNTGLSSFKVNCSHFKPANATYIVNK